jgi:fructose-bisphosphate aldolase / 6-deoxy-5-ketofructose 1-phosphate synthase
MKWFSKKYDIDIPADVHKQQIDRFAQNYQAITRNTNRLFLFSADQKIEHMNDDFYGPGIAPDDNNPQHLFEIASKGNVGAMATQLGLLSRYGNQYPDVNYIVKLNGKTNLIKPEQQDPISMLLWTIDEVISFQKHSNLSIRGIGYTVYLGSEFEAEMLEQAANAVYKAHMHGLVTILWMYPRGKSIADNKNGHLIAGAAGVAAALGADFVKINPPESSDNKISEQWLAIASQAAGNTKIICSGGETIDPKSFLERLYAQLHTGHTAGNATGRNIHQKPLDQAIAFTHAIAQIVYENKNINDVQKLI